MKTYQSTIRCPHCGKPLFSSVIIGDQEVSVEIQCHKCKAFYRVDQLKGKLCVKDIDQWAYEASAA